jgi:D-glycero-alpha-D-manno-heptose-7-phosphate kinase
MLIVRSPVRISFGGGGTDLPSYYRSFGGAVLSTAINKYFYTILQKRTDGKLQVISSDLRVVETWHDIARMTVKASQLEIPLSVIKELKCDVSVDLFLASEILPGTGLGSSASVCVGVLKALATYLDLRLSKYQLAERAFHIARNVLGKAVGKQDEYAATFGGLNFITFQPDGSVHVNPLVLRPDLLREFQRSLMLFFTGSAHNSWHILQAQEKSTLTGKRATLESMHQIRDAAGQMREVLTKGNFQAFAALLHQGWEAKKKLSAGISNPLIDQAYSAALRSGALGGKITGAGGGGFLLLFCAEPNQPRVREAMAGLNIREMAFEFDVQGAQVVTNDPFIDGDERCGARWTFAPVANKAFASGHTPANFPS